jgi:ABC-type multidrug transport system fused ATPase/permease subunit
MLVIASFLVGLTESAILTVVAQAAAALVEGTHRVHASVGSLHVSVSVGTLLAGGFALTVARLILQAPVSVLPARIAADVQAGLRQDLFGAFTRASWAVQSRDREGHLQELLTNQVAQASGGALQATTLVTATLTLAVLVVSAMLLNVVAAAVVLTAAVMLFVLLRPLNQLGGRQSRALSQAQMNYASGVGEATRVAEETRVFGVAAAQRQQVGHLIGVARDLYFRTQLLGRMVPNLYQSFIYMIVVLGLAALYAANAGHVATLGAVVLLLVRAGTYGQQVQGSYQFVRQALPYVDRIEAAERNYASSMPAAGTRSLTKVSSLAFDNVSYAYVPGRNVLSDISFEVAGGEAIGIVGPSGAGKSTLVQILLQLRVADRGRYVVNGEDAAEFVADDWYARVAYVPQEPHLLHASVADNIRYFRPLDAAAVERAARLARIHDDIVTWSNGYETIVGPRADAVSGGQQQRICIARALAAQPDVVVLDEPTSALDPLSESRLQESLRELTGTLTLFIIAHRMSTITICDRVMVVADGRVEAFDTVARLKRHNAYYRYVSTLTTGTASA